MTTDDPARSRTLAGSFVLKFQAESPGEIQVKFNEMIRLYIIKLTIF